MTYAILNASAITAHGTPRQIWPDVSFPRSGPNAAFLAEQGAIEVRSDLPHDSETHYLQGTEPYLLDGAVYDRVAVERPVPEPEPQWQGFQVGLLTDPQVHDMMMSAKDRYPGLISAWSTGLGQSATGQGFETFLTTWGLAQQLPHPSGTGTLLPPALMAHVAAMAAGFDLPAAFVAGLNPEPVTPDGRQRFER